VSLPGGAVGATGFTLDVVPPTSTVTNPPISFARSFPVSIVSDDDMSGVNKLTVQYRIGDAGDWTDWVTRSTGYDYTHTDQERMRPIFGGDEPVTVRPGMEIQFRVRATDRAGNIEAEHLVADSVTVIGDITQITNAANRDSGAPAISADGSKIAFVSNADFTGENADGNKEVFLFDVASGAFTQVTRTTGSVNASPSISGDGSLVALHSDRDLAGNNADGNLEVFLFDVASGLFTQVTKTSGGSNTSPKISADGTRVAFESDRDLAGGNPGNNPALFLFDISGGSFSQIATTTGATGFAHSINSDGTRVAFQSSANLINKNPDGNVEIFLFDSATGQFTQATNTTGGVNETPSINASGTVIALISDRDLTGENSDGNREVFVFSTASGTSTQVTNSIGGRSVTPSISADGTRIAFVSNNDLATSEVTQLGQNVDGNDEIFLLDTVRGIVSQVTETTGGANYAPSISADGKRIAFSSSGDTARSNSNVNGEVFLAAASGATPPVKVPIVNLWMLIALALALAASFVVRLRDAGMKPLGQVSDL
jgi:Tol biopolymer transport system component